MLPVCLVVLLALLGTVTSVQVRYDNYRLYSVQSLTDEQRRALTYAEERQEGYIFLETPQQARGSLDLLVPPHKWADFELLSDTLSLVKRLKADNFQTIVESEQSGRRKKQAFGWNDYYSLEDIYSWLDQLAAEYSDILSVESIGQTYEGRDIKVVKLSHKSGNPGIYVEANIHAREWISSATATWLLNEFLTSNDPAVQDLAQNYDWYILPVANPDGFHYTKNTNRLWRKNRYPHNVLCHGTDLNRNFPYHWMEGGASAIPCNDIFAGPRPTSELETQAMIAHYESVMSNIELHLQFHSYGQYILLPYGYQGAEYSETHHEMMEIAEAAAIGFAKRYNTFYEFGTIADVLYVDSGSTTDWTHGLLKTPLSMCYEFRDTGAYGFVLPADQIVPNSEETLDALIAMLAKAKTMGYFGG